MNGMRALAVFDFDDTLVEGDSLWPFLVHVAGLPRAASALLEALLCFVFRRARDKNDPALADFRTFVKARLLKRLLAGRRTDSLGPAIERLRRWRRWNEPVRRALLERAQEGCAIVIASGGLDLYLPALLADLPPHALICTKMEVENGLITGAMASGNCVRAEKAKCLKAWIAAHGPFSASWGYGNFPHDLPMLELVERRVIVS